MPSLASFNSCRRIEDVKGKRVYLRRSDVVEVRDVLKPDLVSAITFYIVTVQKNLEGRTLNFEDFWELGEISAAGFRHHHHIFDAYTAGVQVIKPRLYRDDLAGL